MGIFQLTEEQIKEFVFIQMKIENPDITKEYLKREEK